MKPIQLRLSGLNSYRDMQQIDFAKLCEAGMFGIFGPTGSGKSTILDAITFALYGQVVRMGGTSHPAQVLNQLEDRLFVSFTFELGRDGTRQRYTIEREMSLDKKGNRRPPEVRLIQRAVQDGEQDVVLESKATTATAAVEKLIGLTIHDFTRAVVLPQGQFSKFLTLKGSERNDMLQRIFHLHEYGEKLTQRTKEWFDQNKEKLHRLQIEWATLGDAGPEAMQAAISEVAAMEAEEQDKSKQKESFFTKKQELEQVRTWLAEREQIRERLFALRADEQDMQILERRMTQIEASLAVWPLVEKLYQLDAEWKQTEATLAGQRLTREQVNQHLAQAEQRYQTAHTRLRSEEPPLIQRMSELTQAVEWEAEMNGWQAEMATASAELTKTNEELAVLVRQLEQDNAQRTAWSDELRQIDEQLQALMITSEQRKHIHALRDAKKTWEQERATHAKSAEEVNGAEAQLASVTTGLVTLRTEWEQATQAREQGQTDLEAAQAKPIASEAEIDSLRDELAEVRQMGKEWRERNIAETDLQQKTNEWQKTNAQLENRIAEQEAVCHEKAAHREQALAAKQTAEADLRQWQQENMARFLRSHLVTGEACPVCGSEHHLVQAGATYTDGSDQADSDDEQHYLTRIEACDKAIAAAELAHHQASDTLQALKLEQAGLTQRATVLTEEQALLASRQQDAAKQLAGMREVWHVSTIEELLRTFQQQDTELKAMLEARTEQKIVLDDLQKQVAAERERELEQKGIYDRNLAIQEQLQEQVTAAKTRLTQAEASLTQAEQALTSLRGELSVDDIDAEYQRLEQQETQVEILHKQRTQREQAVKQVQAAGQVKTEQQTQLAIQAASLKERVQEKTEQLTHKQAQWQKRTDGQPAGQLLTAKEALLTQLRSQADESEQARSKAQAEQRHAQEALLKTEEAYQQLSRQRNEADLALQKGLLDAGFHDMMQVEMAYQSKESLPILKKRLEDFRTIKTQLTYEDQRLCEKIGERTVDEAEWQAVISATEELELAWQGVKDQLAIARESLTKISTNHERWVQIDEEMTNLTDEQSRLEELRKLFEGKKFVQFIAEEKMEAIAKDASYHLARMTKNRYVLQIGDDGEFVLRDEAAGGMSRPVSTLSGGETFLTSLSLALALSVEIQMRGERLEFFFLDEGFGTLDPELLEVVLDALEKLRMEDFTIGLISHVPELRVRMPRRLVITPAEPMGAGSRITLESE